MTAAPVTAKPALRGVFHELGFYASVAIAVPVVLAAGPGRATLAAAVFAGCVSACFGASALYHRPTWPARTRAWLARLDHAALYLLIAGTYTPFGLLVLSPGWAVPVLAVVWGGALAAILAKLVWVGSPKKLAAVTGVVLGWVGVVAFSQLLKLGPAGVGLLLAGGVLYSAGAAIYALRRPNPVPSVFGYHELFHALTIAAVACHYVAIVLYVLPRPAP